MSACSGHTQTRHNIHGNPANKVFSPAGPFIAAVRCRPVRQSGGSETQKLNNFLAEAARLVAALPHCPAQPHIACIRQAQLLSVEAWLHPPVRGPGDWEIFRPVPAAAPRAADAMSARPGWLTKPIFLRGGSCQSSLCVSAHICH